MAVSDFLEISKSKKMRQKGKRIWRWGCRMFTNAWLHAISDRVAFNAGIMIALLLLSGCGSAPVVPVQSHEGIVLKSKSFNKAPYYLVNKDGSRVAYAVGQNDELRFAVPANVDVSQCYAVTDDRGEVVSDGGFALPLLQKIRAVEKYEYALAQRVDRLAGYNKQGYQSYTQVVSELKYNRAFTGSQCALPAELPLPEEPYTRCDSDVQCRQDGAAICYTRFIGEEGCGVAFSRINVAGILSNPACAAIAAQMAGEKYAMGDAFVDAIHGAIDDASDELIESDSVGDNMLGYAIKAGSYYVKIQNAEQCTNDFVEANFGPRQRWLQEVYNIRVEPQQSKSRCEVLVGQYNGYSSSLRASFNEENALRVHLSDVQVIKEEISSQRMISPACGASEAKLVDGQMQFNRYAIGVDIEDYKLEGQTESGGVVVRKLVSDMPAAVAGLRENDVITGINGNKVDNTPTMIRLIQASHGEEIRVMYLRNGDEKTLLFKPAARVVNFNNPI